MFKVYGKKGQVVMMAKSLDRAFEGLREGSYKVGEYLIVAPDGKETHFIKYKH